MGQWESSKYAKKMDLSIKGVYWNNVGSLDELKYNIKQNVTNNDTKNAS